MTLRLETNLRLQLITLGCTAVLLLAAATSVLSQTPNFRIEKVARDVYVAVRTEPPGLTVNANSVFIVNDEDVVVVDSTLTPGTAKETIAALRKITNKPVKYVINTHWHDDHIMGNQAYRDAYPGVQFIGHVNTRDYLPGQGLKNRQMAMSEQGYPGFISALKNRLGSKQSVFGGPMDEEELETYASDVGIAERYMAENPGVEIVLPTIVVTDQLVLQRGHRTINIQYFGRGHTSGDLVVYLPREKLVIAGDLVVWPVPYVGSPQSHLHDWSTTLEKILALQPAVTVPGHGKILHDNSYTTRLAQLFRSISEQVEAAVKRGESLEQIRASVKLEEFEKQFAGESRMRKLIFRNYVRGPAIEAAWSDAQAETK